MTDYGHVTGTFTRTTSSGEIPYVGRLSFYLTAATRIEGMQNNPEVAVLVDGVATATLPVGSYFVFYQIEGLPYKAHLITVTTAHTEAVPLNLNTSIPPRGPALSVSQYTELRTLIDNLIANGGGGGTGAVFSVNGKVGTVALTATDVGALPSSYVPPVQSWAQITNKPLSFPPNAHVHDVIDVAGLQTVLDGKQPAGSYALAVHTHAIANVTGLQAALDGKHPAGSYAATSHVHTIANVTGLQTALDGKQAAGSYASTTHVHSYNDLTDVPATFPVAAHSHTTTDVTGLDLLLADKAALDHLHSWNSITEKPATYPPSAHVHGATDLTGVVKSVNGNLPDGAGNVSITTSGSGTITWTDVTDKPTAFTPEAHDHGVGDITATGIPDSTTYLRGDGTWTTPPVGGGGGDVASVNGQTGIVTLDAADVSALPDTYVPPAQSWTQITGKPTTFTPSTHGHAWGDITGTPATYPPTIGTTATTAKAGDYAPAWGEITGKPTTFAPTAHVHLTSEVTGLDTALAGKAPTVHSHVWADVTDKPTTFTPTAHTHDWAEVTSKPATYPPTIGTTATTAKAGNYAPTWGEITSKPSTFAPIIGTTALTAKAGDYVPSWSEVSGKPTTFAPAAHSHVAADLTGVVKTVNGTAPDGAGNVVVSAAWADITGKPSTFAPTIGTTATTAKAGNYVPAWTEVSGKPATYPPTIGVTATTAKAGDYQPTWAQVTSKPATFPPEAHAHAISDVTNLQTTLDGKSPTSHTHAMSSVTGLQTALDNKASVVIVVTGNEARPASNSVFWIGGTTQPVNALNDVDVWFKASA